MKDKKCKHEWRPTTTNLGVTDGVVCIHCLGWRKWENRTDKSKTE